MALTRPSFFVSNSLNLPIMSPTNDRVLGLFTIAFPLILFLDNLFEKKEDDDIFYEYGGEYYDDYYGYEKDYSSPDDLFPYTQDTPSYNSHNHHTQGLLHNVTSNENYYKATYISYPPYTPVSQYSDYESKHNPIESFHDIDEPHAHSSFQIIDGKDIKGKLYDYKSQNAHLQDHLHQDGFKKNEGSQEKSTYTSYEQRIKRNVLSSHEHQKGGTSNHFRAQWKQAIKLGETRSVPEDQAAVYIQLASLLSTAGVDGTNCLQYIICHLASVSKGNWEENFGYFESQDGDTDKGKIVKEGNIGKKVIQEKKTRDKGELPKDKTTKKVSMLADIAAVLLLPKDKQPLDHFVKAANPAAGASCKIRYPACPATLTLVLDSILG